MNVEVRAVLDAFSMLYEEAPGDAETTICPRFTASTLSFLCRSAIAEFTKRSVVERVDSPVIVVGDLHGSLADLLNIFKTYGLPPERKYLFLGDYVDRGEFSVQVISYLFALLCTYPEHVTLVRGNHEFRSVCSSYGFRDDVLNEYQPSVFNSFVEAFSYMPLAAVVDGKIFCVHGGIPEHFNGVEEIDALIRPIETFDGNKLVEDLLWSDPTRFGSLRFGRVGRSRGHVYGANSVDEFYKKTGISAIIRGHESVDTGIFVNPRMNLVTVYSAGAGPGLPSGVVEVTDGEVEPTVFQTVPKVLRAHTKFVDALGCPVSMKRTNSHSSLPRLAEATDKKLLKPSFQGMLALRRGSYR